MLSSPQLGPSASILSLNTTCGRRTAPARLCKQGCTRRQWTEPSDVPSVAVDRDDPPPARGYRLERHAVRGRRPAPYSAIGPTTHPAEIERHERPGSVELVQAVGANQVLVSRPDRSVGRTRICPHMPMSGPPQSPQATAVEPGRRVLGPRSQPLCGLRTARQLAAQEGADVDGSALVRNDAERSVSAHLAHDPTCVHGGRRPTGVRVEQEHDRSSRGD
jgi:hypothetical protein